MRGPIRRHPLAMAVVLLIALLGAADRLGWFGRGQQRQSTGPTDDVAKYHEQVFSVGNVVDGDTVDLNVADGGARYTRVRLWGVDTPEVAGSPRGDMYFGKEASAFTKRVVSGRRVRVELVSDGKTRDRYGRLLAYLVVQQTGRMLNEALLETGHAYADPRFKHPRRERFLQLETDAQQAGVGLWKNVKPEQYPYWKQKRMRK